MNFIQAVSYVAKNAPEHAIFADGADDWNIYNLLDAIDDDHLDERAYYVDIDLSIYELNDGYIDKKVLWAVNWDSSMLSMELLMKIRGELKEECVEAIELLDFLIDIVDRETLLSVKNKRELKELMDMAIQFLTQEEIDVFNKLILDKTYLPD